MKKLLGVFLLIAMISTVGFALTEPLAPKEPLQKLTGDEDVIIPARMIGFTPVINELDEIVGDTLIIGSSPWDQQHNGCVSRQIGYTDGEDWNVYIVWTKLFGMDPGNPRHVVYTTVTDDGAGGFVIDPLPQVQFENGYRSGYTTLTYDSPNAVGYDTFHYAAISGDPWSTVAVIENPWVPNLFNMGIVPNPFALEHLWPHSTFGNTNHVHITMHELRSGLADMMQIPYYRFAPDPVTGLMNPAHEGDPHVITDLAMNICTDITANSTGEQIAAGIVMARFGTIGEVFGASDDTQVNNDLWVFESLDAGVTWEEGIDVTQFICPNYEALPDTNEANGDTLRAYTDNSVIYDSEDNLHVAFTAGIFDFFREMVFYESRIFHWMLDDNGDDVWTQINHQPFAGQTEVWARTTDRPSLYFDDDTGIMWCAMEACDWGPDSTDRGESTWKVNTDIFVTASPPGEYNGLLWTTPVNVTNTKWVGLGGAPPGECRSETDVSVALDSDGDYLHMSYLLDLDAGTGIASAPEGEVTDNPYVYHRVAKQDLLDLFEANATWQANYPMHIDSTGFWQDPAEGAWLEHGGFFTDNRDPLSVGEGNALQPNEFELKQNYPNPFNPSTRIEFSLDRPAKVKLAVYNVLGQEIATLVNRSVKAGSHNVLFMADELPSGVYFYKLSANGHDKVRKMVLMK